MSFAMPEILAVGLFDSRRSFPGMTETMPRHITCYEIELPLEKGGVSWIDGRSYPISPNHVLCARPGQTRWSTLHFKCRYMKFQTQDPLLLQLLSCVPEVFETSRSKEYAAQMDALWEADESSCADREIQTAAKALEIIHLLHADGQRFARQPAILPARFRNKQLHFILEYIDANYREPLALETLAAQLCYSPVYFHKLFSAAMGRTPRQYIQERRLRIARELLALGDLSLAEVAMECGFSSQSYFNYVFKQETGMTPSAYARANSDRYGGKEPSMQHAENVIENDLQSKSSVL